jgi:UDP-glucose 4-epimerase
VAGSQKLHDRLGWAPQFPDLRTIMRHAWNFVDRA